MEDRRIVCAALTSWGERVGWGKKKVDNAMALLNYNKTNIMCGVLDYTGFIAVLFKLVALKE